MKAKAESLSFLATEGAVVIPFFQRRYVWKEENWGDLLDDMLDTRKGQFLGSLILKQRRRELGEAPEVLLIDGQQRLTTLSILLRATYDSFDPRLQANTESSIRQHLFYKQFITDEDWLVKIRHSHFDAESFQEVILGGLAGEAYEAVHSSSSNIKRAYRFFREKLATLEPEAIRQLFVRMLHSDNKYLVLIDLDADEDEQAIFDTINSAGVRLSAADIIKNALFQRAAQVVPQRDLLPVYKSSWEEVFAKDEEAIAFWDSAKKTGRLTRDNIEILLHAVAVIKGFFDPDVHTLSKLSTQYKQWIEALDRQQLISFLREIADYANLYREHILSFDRTTVFSFDNASQRLFHVLEVAEVSTFHPYVLSLLRKYRDQGPTLEKKLRELETFVVRRFIAGEETKSYNKKCLEFIADDALPSTWGRVDDDAFVRAMRNISNKAASLLLFWVELRRRALDRRHDLKELKYCYSLEHVMPQKWEAHWVAVPVVDRDGEAIIDAEKAKAERYRAVYELGNMTLLTSSLNSSLKNYAYPVKLKGEGRKKGISSYADLSITKDDIVDRYDGETRVWNELAIRGRTRALSQEVVAVWP